MSSSSEPVFNFWGREEVGQGAEDTHDPERAGWEFCYIQATEMLQRTRR